MNASSFGKEVLWGLLAIVILLSIPYFTTSRIALDFVIRLAAFGIFATSLNMLVGYGGMVSFGHAMFFGGGAYAFALTLQKTGLGIPAAMLVAIVFSALVALVFEDDARGVDMFAQVKRLKRNMDLSWEPRVPGRLVQISLLPLAGVAAVEGYLDRVESSIRGQFGVDFVAGRVVAHIAHLTAAAPQDTLAGLLARCHA